MAPKKVKKKEDNLELDPESEPTREPSPYDPYQDLRFVPSPRKIQPKRKLKTTKIPVLKKRPSHPDFKAGRPDSHSLKETPTGKFSSEGISKVLTIAPSQVTRASFFSAFRDKGGPNFMLLDCKAAIPPKLTPWVSPVEAHMNRPKTLALQARPQSGGNLRLLRLENFHKEANSLAHYDDVKRQQLRLENYLMERLNKRRGSLLLRKQQVQPQVRSEGQEQRITRLESCDTPPPEKPPVLSFFAYGEGGNVRKGLSVTMTRRQRGHNVITEWLGSPHLTDATLKQLGLTPTNDQSVKSLEEEQLRAWQDSGRGDGSGTEFVPLFPGLAVVGVSYRYMLDTMEPKLNPKSPKASDQANVTYRKRGSIKAENTSQVSKSVNVTPLATPPQAGGVVLFFGEHRLSWCRADTERAKGSYTVEIGCTAVHGHSAVSSTCMRNAGTVAISYNWIKCDQKDPFDLRRYSHVRFAFDCWGGVILPGETHRVPCLYKANDPGYFSEDWRLVTRPVLEAGAPIILRLWGITRDSDKSRRNRENIELRLRSLITETLVKQRVDNIIDYLPLKEVPLKETRFPLVHLGSDLFHLKNPGFHYNSASVYRLSKMIEIIDNQFMSRLKLHSSDYHDSTYQSSSPIYSSEYSEIDFSARDDSIYSHLKAGSVEDVSAPEREHGSIITISGDILAPRKKLRSLGSGSFTGSDEETMALEESDLEDISILTGGFLPDKTAGSRLENIAHIIKVFKRKTDLDRPIVIRESHGGHLDSHPTDASKNPLEGLQGETSQGNLESGKVLSRPLSSRYVGSYVNIVDPNFHVDSLRKRILDFSQPDFQEAAFHVMTEEISKLSFRRQQPKDNWKLTMGLTYLCHALDSFSAYADTLKAACCMGQLQEDLARRRALEEIAGGVFETASEEANDEKVKDESVAIEGAGERNTNNPDLQKASSMDARAATSAMSGVDDQSAYVAASRSKIASEGNTPKPSPSLFDTPQYIMENCLKSSPREVFTKERYRDQYYSGLYTRMYELLCDFLDTVGSLWAVKTELKIDQSEHGIGFTKITNIHRGVKIEDLLETPLPPPWIKLSQRMDAVIANNKRRIASLSVSASASASKKN